MPCGSTCHELFMAANPRRHDPGLRLRRHRASPTSETKAVHGDPVHFTAHHLSVACRQLVVCEGLVIGQRLRISYLTARKRPVALANARLADLVTREMKLGARVRRIKGVLRAQ